MKKLYTLIGAILLSAAVWAEDSIVSPSRPNLLDSMPGVEVMQDSMVGVLLNVAMKGRMEFVEIDGYRVQIYSSNQQQTAKGEALELETKLKDVIGHSIYVQYLPPFWKVRIGDFATYEDAQEFKNGFIQQFPELMGDTYVVRDQVILKR